jgi:serine phosphatase RsbU (regulator of sigma subunit)
MYDRERLLDCIRRHSDKDPAPLAADLYREVIEFAGGTEAGDDITIIAIKRRV